jgi:hypothetical protein
MIILISPGDVVGQEAPTCCLRRLERRQELVSYAQKRAGTSMFEDVQTPLEHLSRNRQPCFLQGFEQLAHMFCGMREIQDTQRVRSMPRGVVA